MDGHRTGVHSSCVQREIVIMTIQATKPAKPLWLYGSLGFYAVKHQYKSLNTPKYPIAPVGCWSLDNWYGDDVFTEIKRVDVANYTRRLYPYWLKFTLPLEYRAHRPLDKSTLSILAPRFQLHLAEEMTADECLPSGLHLQLPVEIFCDLENAAVANTEEFYQNVFNKTSVFVAAIALGDDRPSKP